jgi:hypothetical protein
VTETIDKRRVRLTGPLRGIRAKVRGREIADREEKSASGNSFGSRIQILTRPNLPPPTLEIRLHLSPTIMQLRLKSPIDRRT